MSGISSKAAGKLENRYKFNDGTELNNSFDISLYETDFRLYDPQIGRFAQVDELAVLDYDISPYVFANDNPILMNDPLGLAPEIAKDPETRETSTKDKPTNCDPAVVHSTKPLDARNGQVLPPQSAFWSFFSGQRSFPGHVKLGENYLSVNWVVNDKGYLTGGIAPNRMELVISPDKSSILTIKQVFKLKNFIKAQYVIYRGMKKGTPYIGKALGNLIKRYGSADNVLGLEARIIEGLENIPNNAIALGVEQLVIDLNGGVKTGALSNINNATIKQVYINEAMHWLDSTMPGWEQLLKFQ